MLLAYSGRAYHNRVLSLLESSFLLNLQLLGATTLFIDLELSYTSREVAICISISVAFIQFLGVVCFHVYQVVKKNLKIKTDCCPVQHKDRDISHKAETDGYTLMEDVSWNDLVKRDLINLQYLEDYAENADAQEIK